MLASTLRAWVAVAVVAVALSVSAVETAAADSLSPVALVELGESAGVGAGGIPMGDVNAFTKALTTENGHLKRDNTRLRAEAALANGEAKAAITGNGGLVPPKAKAVPVAALPKSVQQGVKVMEDMQNKVKSLEGKLADSEAEVSAVKMEDAQAKIKADAEAFDAKMASGGVRNHYHLVPYFKVAYGSKEVVGVKKMTSCRSTCDRQKLCKSFSWSDTEKTCYWSVSALDYDDEFTLGVKATGSTSGDPDAKWRTFPGMKFINAQSKERGGGTEKDCQNVCAADISCKSYSYRTNFCSWSDTGLGYDENFHYYEKGEAMSSLEAEKRAQIEKERAALNEQMEADAQARFAESNAEEKEIAGKDAEKAKWMNAEPNSADELKIKQEVAQREQSQVAQFAAAGAKAAGEKWITAEKSFEQKQVKAVRDLSRIEADEKGAKHRLKSAKDTIMPDKTAAAEVEVEIAKINSEKTMTTLDVRVATQAVQVATNALEDAQKANNNAAIVAATQTLRESKVKLKEETDKLGEIQERLDKADVDLHKRTMAIKDAEKNVAELSSAAKKAKNDVEGNVAMQKKMILDQKTKMMNDKFIANQAKMTMLSAKEKEFKSDRGHAKQTLWRLQQDADKIKTDDDRVGLEKDEAAQNAKVFKADEEIDLLSEQMTKLARELSHTKERAAKAHTSKNQADEAQKRAEVTNALAKLEQYPIGL